MDRYRVGKSQQSESTMHCIAKEQLEQTDFEMSIPEQMLETINNTIRSLRGDKTLESVVSNILPSGYIQKRMLSVNYKCLRNIFKQRYKKDKINEWNVFCVDTVKQLEHKEFFVDCFDFEII